MPIIKSAKKKMHQDKKRHARNLRTQKSMKEQIKAVHNTKNSTELNQAYTAIDTAEKKNIIHKNKAARLKSQLSKIVASSTQKRKPKEKKPNIKKT